MAIGFLPPFLPSADGWASHRMQVKRCRGEACYGAVAAHFGTESPKELEWRVDRRRPYQSNGDDSLSNKYRRWRQGKALPSDETVAHVAARSAGGVRLDFWRDLPLWELLAPEPPALRRLHQILEGRSALTRRILFGEPGLEGRINHAQLARHQTLALRNHRSLDAFIALLCLSRKGELLEDDSHHYVPAACAFDLLPRIVYAYRPLRYRWENLFVCLRRIYWRRVYSSQMYFKFPMKTVAVSLRRLDEDPFAILPAMSGIRRRNSDPFANLVTGQQDAPPVPVIG